MAYRKNTARAVGEPIRDTRALIDQFAMNAKAEAGKLRLYRLQDSYDSDRADLQPAVAVTDLPKQVQNAVNMYIEAFRAIEFAGYKVPAVGACDLGPVMLTPLQPVPALVASQALYRWRRDQIERIRLEAQTEITGRQGTELRKVLATVQARLTKAITAKPKAVK